MGTTEETDANVAEYIDENEDNIEGSSEAIIEGSGELESSVDEILGYKLLNRVLSKEFL